MTVLVGVVVVSFSVAFDVMLVPVDDAVAVEVEVV